MKTLSRQVGEYIDKGSWIRKMFEQGAQLKAQYGADNVCDFSLGNPDLPPPRAVSHALRALATEAEDPFSLGYMPNFGYPAVRQALAAKLSEEQGVEVAQGDVVVTCGAAGALNALLRAVMDPGDELVCPAPFFVEYGFYTQNHGGVFKPVPTKPDTFDLDVGAVKNALTDKTRVVLINSPNNPTGRIYPESRLKELAEVLSEHSAAMDRPVYLVADEPYRFLAYGGVKVPSLLPLYPYAVVVSSFSKSLSLAGERVGYALVNPAMPGKDELVAALVLTNRILGFVNAPAVGQKILLSALDSQVDAGIYERRRDAMAGVLDRTGYQYPMPEGAFYFFPKAPGGNDVDFVNLLLQERVLAVPGSGFGMPGFFRLAFCVGTQVIERAEDGFRRAMNRAKA